MELHLADMAGAALQQELSSRRVDIPLVVMTASRHIPTAVDVIKRGAVDCLEKPFADGLLLKVLANAWPMLERNIEIQRRRETAAAYFGSLTKRELDVVRAQIGRASCRERVCKYG